MGALNDLYFLGDRVDSRDYGLQALILPKPQKPERRYQEYSVPGRSGKLRISEDSYEEIEKTASFMCAAADVDRACEWLSSITEISTSAEPGRVFTVSACPGIKTATKTSGLYEFSVAYKCFPLSKDAEELSFVLTSGQTVINPSPEPAYPSFDVIGSGTIVIAVGSQTLVINDVVTPLTIEGGESFMCYDSTGNKLGDMALTPSSDVGFPVIGGDEETIITFSAFSVTMRPNWRYR